mmetsp:Transcript_86921/g.218802  ORF Transcript_86921/g.218802 Transcript_86921/m.218802 type:complete len:204 (-) Transcript_86921:874-1485(-)
MFCSTCTPSRAALRRTSPTQAYIANPMPRTRGTARPTTGSQAATRCAVRTMARLGPTWRRRSRSRGLCLGSSLSTRWPLEQSWATSSSTSRTSPAATPPCRRSERSPWTSGRMCLRAWVRSSRTRSSSALARPRRTCPPPRWRRITRPRIRSTKIVMSATSTTTSIGPVVSTMVPKLSRFSVLARRTCPGRLRRMRTRIGRIG